MATTSIGLTATLDISDFQRSAATYMRTLQQMQAAAAQSTTGINNSFTQVGSMGSSLVPTLYSIGKGFLAIGAAATAAAVGGIAYMASSSIQMASGLEQSMADIAAIMGQTATEIQPLATLIKELAIDPKLKVSFDEASEAAMTLAKSGIHMEEQMGGALRGVIEGVNATGASYDYMARAVGSTLDVFRLESSKTSHVVDGMVGVLNNSRMSVTDYTYAVNNAGAVMRQFGVSSDQFNAILVSTRGEFSSGRTQGTGYSNMLRQLTAPTDKAAGVMAKLGITVADENGRFKQLFQIIQEVQGALGKLSQAESNEAMQILFGTEGRKAFSALLGLNKKDLDALTISVNASGQAAAAAETRMFTLESQFGAFKDIIGATAISIGSMFTPLLRDAFISINTTLNPLVRAFDQFGLSGVANTLKLSDASVEMATSIDESFKKLYATLTTGGIIAAINEMGISTDTLAFSFYALTGAIGALTILGTVAATIFVIGAAFAALTSPIGILITTVALLGAAWNTNFMGMRDAVKDWVVRLESDFNKGVDAWRFVFSEMERHATIGVNAWLGIFNRWTEAIYKGVNAWLGIFKRGTEAIYKGVSAIFNALPEPVKVAMTYVYDLVTSTMNSAIDYVNSALSSISAAAGGYIPDISLPNLPDLGFPDMAGSGAGLADSISSMFTLPPGVSQSFDVAKESVYRFAAATAAATAAAAKGKSAYADYATDVLATGSAARSAGKSIEKMAEDVVKAKEKISDTNLSMANLRGEIAGLESQFPGLTNELINNFNAHTAAGNSVASFGDKLGATERRQMFNYLTKLIDMNEANKVLAASNGLVDSSLGTVSDGFLGMVSTMSVGLNESLIQLPAVASMTAESTDALGVSATNLATTPLPALVTELNNSVTPSIAMAGTQADTLANSQFAGLNEMITTSLSPSLGQLFTVLSTQVTPAMYSAGVQSDALKEAYGRLVDMGKTLIESSTKIYEALKKESQLVQDLKKYYEELTKAKKDTAGAGGSTGAPPNTAGAPFASGGSFVVPSGYPSHGYGMPMRVHSGELVKVFTAAQTRQMSRSQGNQRIVSSSNSTTNNSNRVVNFNITTQQPSKSILSDLAFAKAKYGVF